MFVPTGELLTELYDELHRLASSFLRNERSNHTLQPSALINETYVRRQLLFLAACRGTCGGVNQLIFVNRQN